MRTVSIAPRSMRSPRPVRPRWTSRLWIRIRAGRFDRALDAGGPVAPGSPLALHVERLESAAERRSLAATLSSLDARARAGSGWNPRIPLQHRKIIANEALLAEIRQRLEAPARARGVARLRLLLADGGGPLYATGRGSLAAALRGVLAAL